MPDDTKRSVTGKTASIIEKLKREISLVSHFVSDVLCYFENNPDGSFVPEFLCDSNFLGFGRELEDSATWFFNVLHPEDFVSLQKNIRKVLHGVSGVCEVRLKDFSGDYQSFRVVGKPIWPNERNGFVAGGILGFYQIIDQDAIPEAPRRETVIDTVLSNYLIVDEKGIITSYSGRASHLLGAGAAGKIEGNNFSKFFTDIPEDLQGPFGSDKYLEADLRTAIPGNPCQWIQVCVFPIVRTTHEAQSFVVLRDITAKKLSEQALTESEYKFRALSDHAPCVIFIMSEGRLVFVNDRAGQMLGYEVCEMLREDFDFSGIFSALNPAGLLADIEDELVKSSELQREVTVKHKNGKTCKCIISLTYMIYHGKKAVMGILNDISDLHLISEKLDETRQRYWVLFEASSDAIFLETIDGTILDCNASCEKLYGYSRTELLGMNANDLIPDECIETLEKLAFDLQHARASGRNFSLEAMGKRKEGSIFPVEVMVSFVRLSGEECFAVTIRDISARKEIENARLRYENQLAQLQKLDNLGQMANGLANDFNNLLTGIMGYSDLILRDLPSSSGSREKARRIIDAARKASEIIQQLMSYTGKMPSFFQKISILKLIKEIQPAVFQMAESNVRLSFELADSLPEVKVDAAMIKQALLNIINNAFEAIDSSVEGEVKVLLKSGDKDFSGSEKGYFGPPMKSGNYLMIGITDNGSGIEPELINRIFDPFFSTKFSRRGLGLSFVMGMLRGHHGAVFVDSRPLAGTEFYILLPCEASVKTSVETSEAVTENYLSGMVLVVDDEESVRELFSVNLRDMGYEVVSAENGLIGLEMFKQHNSKLSLVVLDLVMPEMRGDELLRKIRWLNPEIPVLICSGYISDNSRLELKKLGVSAFLEKPFITRRDLEKVFVQIQLKVKDR